MVVSHARDFLNVVCTDILHLHSRKLTSYKGDFDTFERTATERLRNAKKAAEGQERQRAHMQVCVLWPDCIHCCMSVSACISPGSCGCLDVCAQECFQFASSV